MSSKQKKIGLVILAGLIIFVGIRFVNKDTNESSKVEIYSSISEGETTEVYSNDNNGNSFYFLTAIKGISIVDFDIIPAFDKDVVYEISYEKMKSRSDLPIEYYLAGETEFDFNELEEFQTYLSEKEVKKDYEKNKEYDAYIKDYKDNKDYRNYMKNFSLYMIEVKVVNATQKTSLNSVKFVEKFKEPEDEKPQEEKEVPAEIEKAVENDTEQEAQHIIYNVNTNIVYMNTSSNSGVDYRIDNNSYEQAKYYNGQIKYDFSISCNNNISLSNFTLSNYSEVKTSVYKSGVLMKDNYSCSSGDVLNIFVEFKVNDIKYFDKPLLINFDMNGTTITYHTPQIFAPSNFMLIKEEELNKYSNYFEYTFNK